MQSKNNLQKVLFWTVPLCRDVHPHIAYLMVPVHKNCYHYYYFPVIFTMRLILEPSCYLWITAHVPVIGGQIATEIKILEYRMVQVLDTLILFSRKATRGRAYNFLDSLPWLSQEIRVRWLALVWHTSLAMEKHVTRHTRWNVLLICGVLFHVIPWNSPKTLFVRREKVSFWKVIGRMFRMSHLIWANQTFFLPVHQFNFLSPPLVNIFIHLHLGATELCFYQK